MVPANKNGRSKYSCNIWNIINYDSFCSAKSKSSYLITGAAIGGGGGGGGGGKDAFSPSWCSACARRVYKLRSERWTKPIL